MVKKAFSLIELIFIIVLLGILASVAIPKFSNISLSSKKANLKAIVSSIHSEIENIHAKWIINDNMKSYEAADGSEQNLTTNGYPQKLDNNDRNIFSFVLNPPLTSCTDNKDNCFEEEVNSSGIYYRYYFSPNSYILLKYNQSNGRLECLDGSSEYNKSECEKIIY